MADQHLLRKVGESDAMDDRIENLQKDQFTSNESNRLTLSIKGIKSSQILSTIAFFQNYIDDRLTAKQKFEFRSLMQKMLAYIENHEDEFRKHQSDSVAGCAMLIVSSFLGVSRKDFLAALRPLGKNLFRTVERIKKSACYNRLKEGFGLIKKVFQKELKGAQDS